MRAARTFGRRGSYAALFAASTTMFLGFSTLAVDLGLIRLAEAELQSIADAAAQGALQQLRSSANREHAQAMAEATVAANQVIGRIPATTSVTFGVYEAGSFTPTEGRANAIRVDVSAELPTVLGQLWGHQSYRVATHATAATRTLHAVLAVDITNSWKWQDFEKAREGAVSLFDRLTLTGGPDDRIGMALFYGWQGVEYTPLTLMEDAIFGGVRDDWATLRTASVPGVPHKTNGSCKKHGSDDKDDFEDPPGGCYPHMPREYSDEGGTDHAVGIQTAAMMLAEYDDPTIYRALIVITDGKPNGTEAHKVRGKKGYVEERWRIVNTGFSRSKDSVPVATVQYAEDTYASQETNIWMVSYKEDDAWMEDVPQGDGDYIVAQSIADLQPILDDILESLPLALVE